MHTAFIALGSNLGDPEEKVRQGIAALAALPQAQLLAASALYRSAALGHTDQPDFVNAVAQMATSLAPQALVLAPLLEIAPACVIPGKGPAADWLARCRDQVIEKLAPC